MKEDNVALSLEQEIELIKNATPEEILTYLGAGVKEVKDASLSPEQEIERIKGATPEEIVAYIRAK